MFISEDVLNKEKDHIEGFAPEVAWVTHAYARPQFTAFPGISNC
jgi:prolyl-tRNA synthetase